MHPIFSCRSYFISYYRGISIKALVAYQPMCSQFYNTRADGSPNAFVVQGAVECRLVAIEAARVGFPADTGK